MENSSFYNHIEETELNKSIISKIKEYANQNPLRQVYLINSPLGEKYNYDYAKNVIVILSPKHKIIFLNLGKETDAFDTYYEDFIEDLSYISDKYNYKEHIGRPREWKDKITCKIEYDSSQSIQDTLEENKLEVSQYRIGELLISLLTGSINDIEKVGVSEPDSILEKVRKNIILFDGDQTRFIYKEFSNKVVSIQGLSGTGKTELLLHKLKELYIKEEDNIKIFFTCHNIALANTLRERIPSFFNFMKVEKQIEWNSKLWVNRAWGSRSNPNSGLYSYLSNFYDFPFLRYERSTDYKKIFTPALKHIESIKEEDFKYAFDYILIDERQDFPDIFFELCEKVTRHKVFIAGDIFQDIFENTKSSKLDVDIILNKCYRTDPRTLMFAHSVGLGLFEQKKLNWFSDDYWRTLGYQIKREEGQVVLSREPIRRFDDLNIEEDFKSAIIKNTTKISDVIDILKSLKNEHPTLVAEDIGIIILDDNDDYFKYIDSLIYRIQSELNWNVNRAIETKTKISDTIYVTNSNNVKGLEFHFVICITGKIGDSYRKRNTLYAMLTRSFIQSYLLVTDNYKLDEFRRGLEIINKERSIKTIEPTESEKQEIENTLAEIRNRKNISYKEFINGIFDELNITKQEYRNKLEKIINVAEVEPFNKEQTKKIIEANKNFL